jgi:hypothetical protein
MARLRLLNIFHDRCEELGVKLRFETDITDLDQLEMDKYDLVLAGDGITSMIREKYEDKFQTSMDWRQNKFCWLATTLPLNAFTFIFRVLIGDAAHTAHFSIGSGTKLAMEDAIVLARELGSGKPLAEALAAYQAQRHTEALRLQNAARNSMEWFENVRRYVHLEPEQFAYSLLTRSQRVSHENLRLRDRRYLEGVDAGGHRGLRGARTLALRPARRAPPRMLRVVPPPPRRTPSPIPPSLPCSRRSASATCASTTACALRPWTCTAPWTARRTTSTWSTSAPARWAARAWSSRR